MFKEVFDGMKSKGLVSSEAVWDLKTFKEFFSYVD